MYQQAINKLLGGIAAGTTAISINKEQQAKEQAATQAKVEQQQDTAIRRALNPKKAAEDNKVAQVKARMAQGMTMEEAMKHMQLNGQQQVKQRRSFHEYLLQSSDVYSQISASAQAQVRKTYTAAERKKLMDDMDKERGKK